MRKFVCILALLAGSTLMAQTPQYVPKAASTVYAGQYASLNAAAAACPGSGCTIFIYAPISLSANLTIPATTRLQVAQGGSISTTGFTLTINGPVDAGRYQIFTGSGAISGLTTEDPEWITGTPAINASVIAALVSTGSTLSLGNAAYASAYTATAGACITKDNITVSGSKPYVNSGETALIGGSIILGGLEVCGSNNFSVHDVGFDVGSAYIAGGGSPSDGLNINGLSGGTNLSDPLIVGGNVTNIVSLLSSYVTPYHAFLFEHQSGGHLNNITTVYGQHGIVIKSIGVTLQGWLSKNCQSECLDFKADAYTTTSQDAATNGFIISETAGSMGNAVNIDAENGASLSGITLSGVQMWGPNVGLNLLDDSTSGGTVSNINLSSLTFFMTQNVAGTPKCFTSTATSGTTPFSNVQVSDVQCISTVSVVVPISLGIPVTNLQLNNWMSSGVTSVSTLLGTVSVNGWIDAADTTTTGALSIAGSGSTLTMSGFYSPNGNRPCYTDGIAVCGYTPSPQALSGDPTYGAIMGGGVTADLVVQNAARTANNLEILDSGIVDIPNGILNVQNSPVCTIANGCNGFSGTKTAGSCVMTVLHGIITNITGC